MFKAINAYFQRRRQQKFEAFRKCLETNFENYRQVGAFWAATSILQDKYGEKYYDKISGWILENNFGYALSSVKSLDLMSRRLKEPGRDRDWMLHYNSAIYVIYRKWSENFGMADIFDKLIHDSVELSKAEVENKDEE